MASVLISKTVKLTASVLLGLNVSDFQNAEEEPDRKTFFIDYITLRMRSS